MSENSEIDNNSSEEMQTNSADELNHENEPSSTSQQALKQLNQLTAGTSAGAIVTKSTAATTTTTIPAGAIQKTTDQKLAMAGGPKIVYIKNTNGTPTSIRTISGQPVFSFNATNNTTTASNPNIRKVQLVSLKNKNILTAPLNTQRIVLKNATLLSAGGVAKTNANVTTVPRTLTMSQAQQMGIITTSINKTNSNTLTNTTTKTIILPASSNTGTTIVKNSQQQQQQQQQPTILNKGIKQIQSKVLVQTETGIGGGGDNESNTKPKSISSNQTQNLIKVTGQQVRAVNVPGKGLQYVRVLSTVPAPGTGNGNGNNGGNQTKTIVNGRPQQIIQQRKILPQNQTTLSTTAATTTAAAATASGVGGGGAINKQFITRKLEVLPVGSGTKIIKKEHIINNQNNKLTGTYLLNNVQKNIVTSTIDIKPVASNQTESFEITEIKEEPSTNDLITESPPSKKYVQRTYSTSNELRRSRSPDGNHSNVMYSTLKLPSPDPMVDGIRRKHCNCTKSQCLKLYCDCFANGEFCSNCNCKECFNTLEKEDERQKAIKICLERNPHAFKPKIGKSRDQSDTLRRHTKGCNCKRSGCLKNYCECYEAKIACSANCKCLGCRNIDDHMENNDRDGSQYDLNQTVKRTYSQLDEKSIKSEPIVPPKKPCNFITPDVIEATVQCIIAQADDCAKNNCDAKTSERKILEEFGRCLVEIIEFSKKNNDNPDD